MTHRLTGGLDEDERELAYAATAGRGEEIGPLRSRLALGAPFAREDERLLHAALLAYRVDCPDLATGLRLEALIRRFEYIAEPLSLADSGHGSLYSVWDPFD